MKTNCRNLHIAAGKLLLLSVTFLSATSTAFATDTGLQINGGLDTLTTYLTGPFATSLGMVAIAGGGVGLLRGDDLSGWPHKLAMVAVVVGTMVAAGNVMNKMFSAGVTL